MHDSLDVQPVEKVSRIYASLMVVDGARRLKPAAVGPDRLRFFEPPGILSKEVEIIITNGADEQRHLARVLPHDPAATDIPIEIARLLSVNGVAPAA